MNMKKLHNISSLLILACALTGGLTAFTAGCAATPTSDSTGEYIDDSTITTKVKAKLVQDDTVKARQVDVTTFKGVVQLSGFVDTAEQKSRAAELAATVPGVRDVKNNIEVK
jgi:osmotically-inducible protein OsmY